MTAAALFQPVLGGAIFTQGEIDGMVRIVIGGGALIFIGVALFIVAVAHRRSERATLRRRVSAPSPAIEPSVMRLLKEELNHDSPIPEEAARPDEQAPTE